MSVRSAPRWLVVGLGGLLVLGLVGAGYLLGSQHPAQPVSASRWFVDAERAQELW